MRLTKLPLQTPSDSDRWGDSLAGRRETAERLANLIGALRDPFVISLHAPYGAGKSYFLDRFALDLRDQGHCVIRFNAWETDFSSDPLMALLAQILRDLEIESDNNGNGDAWLENIKSHLSNLAKATAVFAKKELPTLLLHAILKHAIGDEAVQASDKFIDTIKKEADEYSDGLKRIAADRLDLQIRTQECISRFRNELSSLVSELSSEDEKGVELKFGRKMIFLVDELDRCRPNFSVEFLEYIKHLFNINGIVFILSIDDKYLENSVESVFGFKMESKEYLRKFVDLSVSFPNPDSIDFVRMAFHNLRMEQFFGDSDGDFIFGRECFAHVFSGIADLLKVPLRTQEQILSKVFVAYAVSGEMKSPLAGPMAIACLLHELHGEVFRRLVVEKGEEVKLIEMGITLSDMRKILEPNSTLGFVCWDAMFWDDADLKRQSLLLREIYDRPNYQPDNATRRKHALADKKVDAAENFRQHYDVEKYGSVMFACLGLIGQAETLGL